MSQGEVKNPQTDKRVDNKSGKQGRDQGSKNRSSSSRSDRDMDSSSERQ